MYEFTHQGMWFKWNLLDKVSKRLAGVSLFAAGVSVVPATMKLCDYAFEVGKAAGSGIGSPDPMLLEPWQALWLIGFGTLSAVFWWRFSLRQDEMFNRVQNWSLGMAGAWTATFFALWGVLAFGGIVPPLHPMAVFLVFYVALLGFWFAAVRRWA
jgi:hypothetical protein